MLIPSWGHLLVGQREPVVQPEYSSGSSISRISWSICLQMNPANFGQCCGVRKKRQGGETGSRTVLGILSVQACNILREMTCCNV